MVRFAHTVKKENKHSMWFTFAIIALLCWSGSDLFSKIGCQDGSDTADACCCSHGNDLCVKPGY